MVLTQRVYALLSPEQTARYDRDGVVCIRGAFDTSWVGRLRAAVADVMAAPRPTSTVHGPNGAGRFFSDVNMWQDHPTFRAVGFDSPAIEIVAELMGASKLNLYNQHLLVKEPGSPESPTPWHQDQPYFRTDGWQVCSIWIALDRVTEDSGAMRFVIGSHRWGKMFQPVRFTSSEAADADDFDGPVPDIEGGGFETVCYELEPGDCTVHHGLTLHAAGGNLRADRSRRGLSMRFTGDDARFVERKWHPTTVETDLGLGDPLDSDVFPVVWTR